MSEELLLLVVGQVGCEGEAAVCLEDVRRLDRTGLTKLLHDNLGALWG